MGSIWQRSGGWRRHNTLTMKLVTAPAIEPVTLTQVKQHAHIPYSYTDNDALLALYISAARDRLERYLRRALVTQTWDAVLDWGPAWIELPKKPLKSVTGIYTTDLANVETLVDSDTYEVSLPTDTVQLASGYTWPEHRNVSGFRVRYVAGYGDAATDVPALIRAELLTLATLYYDNRGVMELPGAMQTTLRPYRVEGEPYRFALNTVRDEFLA